MAAGVSDPQVDMVKLMMKSKVAGGMPTGSNISMATGAFSSDISMNLTADSLRDIVRQVDFWTEEENDRLLHAVALDTQAQTLGLDWDVICK